MLPPGMSSRTQEAIDGLMMKLAEQVASNHVGLMRQTHRKIRQHIATYLQSVAEGTVPVAQFGSYLQASLIPFAQTVYEYRNETWLDKVMTFITECLAALAQGAFSVAEWSWIILGGPLALGVALTAPTSMVLALAALIFLLWFYDMGRRHDRTIRRRAGYAQGQKTVHRAYAHHFVQTLADVNHQRGRAA